MSSLPRRDPQTGELIATQKPPINWLMVTPMFFMALPLVRHFLKGNPYRDRIFLGLIGVGLVHGSYLIMSAGETASSEPAETFVTPAQLARQRVEAASGAVSARQGSARGDGSKSGSGGSALA